MEVDHALDVGPGGVDGGVQHEARLVYSKICCSFFNHISLKLEKYFYVSLQEVSRIFFLTNLLVQHVLQQIIKTGLDCLFYRIVKTKIFFKEYLIKLRPVIVIQISLILSLL